MPQPSFVPPCAFGAYEAGDRAASNTLCRDQTAARMKPCLPQVATHRTIHPPDVIVGPSRGRGRGVFARRGFEPNETIEVCPVVVLSEADARRLRLGWRAIHAGRSTSPQRRVPGSMRWKPSSPLSPVNASDAAASTRSSTYRPPSSTTSPSETLNQGRSSGPLPQHPSSPRSCACPHRPYESEH